MVINIKKHVIAHKRNNSGSCIESKWVNFFGVYSWMEDFLHQLIGDLSHCLKVFNYPRWCKISSTHRTLGGSNPWGCPKNGWFCIGKNLTNVDDFWGTPMTWETSIVDAKANGRNSLVEHTMNISNIRSDFEKLL